METDLELKNIDDNQLKEADMVVDDENNLVDTEIQEVDGLIVDIDEEENLVATTVPQTPRPSLYLHSETPGGSVYWEPNVESIYLPIEGKVFDTIEECVDFYTEGVPKDININTLDLENSDKQVRNTRHRITGCKARIKVDLHPVSGKYEITKFVCKHNHQMIPKHYKHLTKKQRKMTQTEKMFVVKASTMKLGATRAHNLYSSMKGGAQYVHGTSDDFKNHIRDVNAFIGESDAQMLINKMENRKKFVPNFTFQYKVENSELVAMFWADEVDKCNYKEFGDIISFDATFRTNKYDMVFVPFTGIDNHRKCVTVGSGLLLREDTEAYTWLLRSFMTAHEKQPTMIICIEIYDETDFKERFNKIVWNMFMEPMEFEEKWSKLIEDFGLQNHKWMKKMFNLREMWLPAYFIDSPLFGLMRTTSRSESENAFVKSFTNHGSTLVNFMMCFESAMERQRYKQEALDFRTFDSAPKIHTKLRIEIHAYKVYTRTIFLLVQKEIIEAVWACQILECKTEEGCEIVKVRDKRASAYRTLDTEKEKEAVQQKEYVAEYKDLLSKDEGMLATFLEQLKTIKQEVQVQVPKPPSQKTGDVIEDIYAVEKPQQNDANNPQRARNKGGRRGERRKSRREIALKAKTRQIRKCVYYGEKTNKHTKSTCPSNPKYVAKLETLVVVAAEQGTTTAAATEQETTTAAEQGATTEEATTTAIVSEEETNAS
ncbi:FAR1-related sequence 5-like protein [Tanacetum coccineum]